MTNQQVVPEALRTIRRFYRGTDCMAENQAGDWVRYEDHVAALVEAQQPAPSAASLRVALEQAARQALETLERASDAGYSVECDETITALREALEQVAPRKTEQWNPMNSSNAETALQMAAVIAHRDTEAAHQQAVPQADSQPAPVPTSETGGDWTQPTTVAMRLGDAMQLLCGGKRPPDDMVQQWLDNTSESLQEFAASNGPAWAQGIGLIDAAMVMVDQPTEITTIDNPDRDHEHRAARAPADSVTAPAGGVVDGWKLAPKEPTLHMGWAYLDAARESEPLRTHTFNHAGYRAMLAAAPTPPAQAANSLLEDAARLDWLALAGPTSICLVIDRPHDGEVEVATDDVTGYGKTPREAIDAASKQGGAT